MLTIQLLLAAALPLLLAFAPPARGRLLLVPLTRSAEAAMLPLATGLGARLIGGGPVGGSFVIMGERARLVWPLLRAGIVPIGGSGAGCHAAGDKA